MEHSPRDLGCCCFSCSMALSPALIHAKVRLHPDVNVLESDIDTELSCMECGWCGRTAAGGRSMGMFVPSTHPLASTPVRMDTTPNANSRRLALAAPQATSMLDGDNWREQMLQRIRRRHLADAVDP